MTDDSPDLDALGGDQLIKCDNPDEREVWFFEVVDGEVVRYHPFHGYESNREMPRNRAEYQIGHDAVDAKVVDRSVLEEHQRQMIQTDGGTVQVDGQVTLTDDGVEAPKHVVGRTGVVTVETPSIQMDITFAEPCREIEPELFTFPPTGEDQQGYDIPEGHVKIGGRLYEVIDGRDLDECPHCGSDKVAACDTPQRCYSCEQVIDDE